MITTSCAVLCCVEAAQLMLQPDVMCVDYRQGSSLPRATRQLVVSVIMTSSEAAQLMLDVNNVR